MTEAAKLMLGAMLGALNSILGDFANNVLSQVLAFYVNFNFRTMFTLEFLHAYAIIAAFGILLTVATTFIGIIVEMINGKGRFHRIVMGGVKAIVLAPALPIVSYVVFGGLNTLVQLIVASGKGFGASVSGLSGTGSALSLPGALLLVFQLSLMWAVLALTVLMGPILMVAWATGNWGSRFMRGIYVVIGTTLLTQPVALFVLVVGFFVSKLEIAMKLPSLVTGPTPVIFFVLAAITPIALFIMGYVKIVQVEGGQLDESGKGEVEAAVTYNNSPIRSIIEGVVPIMGGSTVPFVGELGGDATGMLTDIAKSDGARNALAGLLQNGGGEAAMLAIGQPELVPVARVVAPILGRALEVPETAPQTVSQEPKPVSVTGSLESAPVTTDGASAPQPTTSDPIPATRVLAPVPSGPTQEGEE